MKKVFLACIGIVCIFLLSMAFASKNKEETQIRNAGLATTTLSFDGGSFVVEIADTSVSRAQGLSGRAELLEGNGMFFMFPKSDFYSFWMKDMNFEIDILWLNSDFHVVHILPAVSPETYPESFTPPVRTQYVLEIPAHESKAKGVVVGTQFALPTL